MLWVVMYVLFVDICATFLLQELSLKYKQMTYRYFYFACNGHSIISSILLVIHSKTSAGTVATYIFTCSRIFCQSKAHISILFVNYNSIITFYQRNRAFLWNEIHTSGCFLCSVFKCLCILCLHFSYMYIIQHGIFN